MSVKLSKTELEVGKLYFEQGKKPKEIAELLGLSINTVYKAISKYRSYIRELEKRNEKESSSRGAVIDSEEGEKYRNECQITSIANSNNNGNGKVLNVIEESVEKERKRRTMTIISFKATFVLVPVEALTMVKESKGASTEHVIERPGESELFSKVTDSMLMIARELESIRDVLMKIAEHLENVRTIREIENISNHLESRDEKENESTDDMPSFIKDNVWVDIIKSKYTSTD